MPGSTSIDSIGIFRWTIGTYCLIGMEKFSLGFQRDVPVDILLNGIHSYITNALVTSELLMTSSLVFSKEVSPVFRF